MSTKMLPDYDAEVGANLRALRLSFTAKQTDLAARLGVQRAAVTRWEQGTRGLTVDMLLKIAETFGIPASRLLPERHREASAAPTPTEQPAAPPSLEESAIASIVQVLRERPELIVAVMQSLEQQSVESERDHIA
jgi:transcriptional regulator with XRE-family HTH domain